MHRYVTTSDWARHRTGFDYHMEILMALQCGMLPVAILRHDRLQRTDKLGGT